MIAPSAVMVNYFAIHSNIIKKEKSELNYVYFLNVLPEISHSFVFTFNMNLQRTCCSCGKLTLRISHSSMFTFNMIFQMTCCSCTIFTLRAGKSHSFMSTFNMFLQSTCCSRGKLTLRAGMSDSLMFTFNMSL